jgi:hypothetical protein
MNLVAFGRLEKKAPGERALTEAELRRSRLPAAELDPDSKI